MPEDKEIKCKDCGGNFIFTVGEQEFFQQKGFSEPVRCKACRDIRKSQKSEDRYGEPSGANKRW